MNTILDKFRMLAWLVIGLTLYLLSFGIGIEHPSLQTIAYKLGHVTTLAWCGYWISRSALGRLDDRSCTNLYIARAIVIGCVILAGSMGL